MFSNLLVKTFIKDNENIENEDVRNKYGYLAGIVGIIANFILFGVKLSVGLLTSSIAIMADAMLVIIAIFTPVRCLFLSFSSPLKNPRLPNSNPFSFKP